jgi:fatty acyl-CoA reductase
MSKVVLITGDHEQRGLGLSKEDRALLVQNVNIIFHSAATVRFDEKLRTAVAINILGTKDMLDLAREMPYLKVSYHTARMQLNA